jgi:hypothetical protein
MFHQALPTTVELRFLLKTYVHLPIFIYIQLSYATIKVISHIDILYLLLGLVLLQLHAYRLRQLRELYDHCRELELLIHLVLLLRLEQLLVPDDAAAAAPELALDHLGEELTLADDLSLFVLISGDCINTRTRSSCCSLYFYRLRTAYSANFLHLFLKKLRLCTM